MAARRSGQRTPSWPGAREGSRTGETLVAIFALGATLFSSLALGIFDGRDATASVSGVPFLYVYLFSAWGLVIVLIAWAVERPAGRLARLVRRMSGRGGRR